MIWLIGNILSEKTWLRERVPGAVMAVADLLAGPPAVRPVEVQPAKEA